jgi:pyruvate/2-oxoglutarate dehydrogenase complex dihydrolipoamide dehydrogenase (E3) component
LSKYDYDVLVIGGGIGGFASALTANALGKKVAIAEKARLGGNCTWYTCIPSKALVKAGNICHQVQSVGDFGLETKTPIELKTDDVMAHVRSVVDKVHNIDRPETFARVGIEVIKGQAEFVDRRRVRVGENIVSARNTIIATGSRPFVPQIEGIDDIPYLTNETVFNLNTLPKSMIILGGGLSGIEFCSAFVRLGIEITVVEPADRILAREDRELVGVLSKQLESLGARIFTSHKPLKFTRTNDKISLTVADSEAKTKRFDAESVLVTTGRRLNLETLGLEKAGIKYEPRGIVTTRRLQTTARNVYACGDAVGPYQFATMAEYQGIIAAQNAILPFKRSVDYKNVVWVIFTDPELGHSGMTEDEARRKFGPNIKVYRQRYSRVRRAMVDGAEEGLGKFIFDNRGKLVGVHILGQHAEELIHEAQLLVSFDHSLGKVHNAIHAYPTYSEAVIKRMADLNYIETMRANPFVRAALKILPGFRDNLESISDKL